MPYQFSVDWFTNNIPRWEKVLKPFAGKELHALEIGTYEGRSALWLLENVLTNSKSTLDIVDHFKDRDPKTKNDTYKTFTKNIKPFAAKVAIHKDYSSNVLKSVKMLHRRFDIIYIDASKNSMNVLEDMILCYPLLKKNGIMIIDDNTYSVEHDARCPKLAIDAFRAIYASDIEVIMDSWQVMLRKKSNPPRRPRCYSELYPKHS